MAFSVEMQYKMISLTKTVIYTLGYTLVKTALPISFISTVRKRVKKPCDHSVR